MSTKKINLSGLSVVEKEYLKALKPELRRALSDGEPERAASFAKAVARIIRKAKRKGAEQ